MNDTADFQALTPDVIIQAVESATGKRMTGFTSPLPSYINRVYELQSMDETRLIAKFYRPGRWSFGALQDEHQFIADCALAEIPVISPLILSNGQTIDIVDDICFTVFPKRFGREFEVTCDEDWIRLGRLVARMHVAGSMSKANDRITLHPLKSTAADLKQLIDGGFVSPRYLPEFKEIGRKLLDLSEDLFENIEYTRIHGDCHNGNLLHRPSEGLMVIDFDDMMMGPPIQDIWLLLPDYANESRMEINLILEGYEQFREFDYRTLKLIEPLRAMRIIYFLAWCSKQVDDFQFKNTFPHWGSDAFWTKEIADLQTQLIVIINHLDPNSE